MWKKSKANKADNRWPSRLLARVREDKRSFAVFLLLSLVICVIVIYSAFQGNWNRVFTGALTLALLLIPSVAEHNFAIRLPTTLEILAYVFVFCAGILGEIWDFYGRFFWWDDLLHAFNGYMFAACGFCLCGLFERGKRSPRTLSPSLVTFVAFCFSMTVGVLWELFEYGTDFFLGMDMQKDRFVTKIYSVALPGETGERITRIREIAQTVITTKNGERVAFSGYLDIGLIDTMTDLFVNLCGALVFCVIGYAYLRHHAGRIAGQFIPAVLPKDEK